MTEMDIFEETIADLKKKSPKEKAEFIADLKSKCPCPGCPSYNSCAQKAGEKLFCINGKSFMCISEEKGCNCPKCPLAKDIGLMYKFFCNRGSEMAQRYEYTIWGASSDS